ncbi:hypothetical protein GCM10011390_38500 [Aureimonas endophytica]|uniref:LUD domain-containing protein n=1 Tax=Aureimonas endophytica TaxID=2027858 RepID=A0A917E8N9_9HYPH|nr:LUD domain-containing protein [Aureimonas endophytica]GGE15680.1 hypothetical protein GCM10011390_38500 [Aureimonas endophytica]
MSGAREAIFGAIGAALGPLAETPRAVIEAEARALLEAPETVRPRLPEGSAVDLFMAAIARLPPGASVERLGAAADVPRAVAAHLGRLGLAGAVRLQPVPALGRLDWAAAGLAPGAEADDGVAVTLAEKGVAETASLVIRSGPDSAVLDAILPLHHVAVLREADVVPYLEDAFAGFDLQRSRNVVLVTGPSGTTDIEGNLVIGVHGPRTLHVLLVPTL